VVSDVSDGQPACHRTRHDRAIGKHGHHLTGTPAAQFADVYLAGRRTTAEPPQPIDRDCRHSHGAEDILRRGHSLAG
jgi:hypothetical protein